MLKKLLLATVLATAAAPVLADTPVLDQRQQNQRARIVEGVRSGELTRPEARRLIKGERRLHRHERRAKRDGDVTARERARLHREANRMSKRIGRQKHDGQTRN